MFHLRPQEGVKAQFNSILCIHEMIAGLQMCQMTVWLFCLFSYFSAPTFSFLSISAYKSLKYKLMLNKQQNLCII